MIVIQEGVRSRAAKRGERVGEVDSKGGTTPTESFLRRRGSMPGVELESKGKRHQQRWDLAFGQVRRKAVKFMQVALPSAEHIGRIRGNEQFLNVSDLAFLRAVHGAKQLGSAVQVGQPWSRRFEQIVLHFGNVVETNAQNDEIGVVLPGDAMEGDALLAYAPARQRDIEHFGLDAGLGKRGLQA